MLSFQRSNIQNFFYTIIVLSFCSLTIFKLQSPRFSQEKNQSATASNAEINREIKAEKLEIQFLKSTPTFGYDNLVANWTFLDFIQYFGNTEARDKTGYGLSPDYFQVILDRDPRFLNAYFFMSTSSSIYAGNPERSIAIMNEKLKLLGPKDPLRAYFIWRYKGFDEILYLEDYQAAENSFRMAAKWAREYSTPEGKRIEQFSGKTAEFLATKPDYTWARIFAWRSLLFNVKDDRTRNIIINKLEKLGATVSINSQGQLQVEVNHSPPNNRAKGARKEG